MNEPTSLLQQTWLDTTKDNTQRLARGLPSPAVVQERGLPKGDSGLNMLENRNFWRCCCTVHSSVGEAVFPHRVVFSGRLLYYPAVVRCHLPQPQLARSALSPSLSSVIASLLLCLDKSDQNSEMQAKQERTNDFNRLGENLQTMTK